MNKFYFDIKKGQHGFLDDGRYYKIVSVPSITMCSDGTLRYGDVELNIDDEFHTIRISEFVEHVSTVGNLTIRKSSKKQAADRDAEQEMDLS